MADHTQKPISPTPPAGRPPAPPPSRHPPKADPLPPEQPLTLHDLQEIALTVRQPVTVQQPAPTRWESCRQFIWNLFTIIGVPLLLFLLADYVQRQNEAANENIARNNRESDAVNSFIDSVTLLLAGTDINRENNNPQIAKLLRAKSLTTVRNIDGDRKGQIIRFLHEQNLIFNDAFHQRAVRQATQALALTPTQATDYQKQYDASVYKVVLSGADLNGTVMTSTWLHDVNLQGVSLVGGQFTQSNLTRADLIGANLATANLVQVDLTQADAVKTNLTGADLRGADLSGANLSLSTFTNGDLRGFVPESQARPSAAAPAATIQTQLHGALLAGADLSGVQTDAYTDFQNAYYTDEQTAPEVCFALLPKGDRRRLLEELEPTVLDINRLQEPAAGWTLAAVVQQSANFQAVDQLITAMRDSQTIPNPDGTAINGGDLFTCPTLPLDFQYLPQMTPIRTLEDYAQALQSFTPKPVSGP